MAVLAASLNIVLLAQLVSLGTCRVLVGLQLRYPYFIFRWTELAGLLKAGDEVLESEAASGISTAFSKTCLVCSLILIMFCETSEALTEQLYLYRCWPIN